MTEYTVGAGGDFPTLTAASKGVKPDDVVNVLPGVYKETLSADTPDVTWRAANYDNQPVIDGGWKGTVEKGFAAQVQIQAAGVVVEGLTVRNCPGRGIGVTASRVTVRNCRIENTYHGGMIVGDSSGPAISGVLIENNVMRKMSQSWVTEKNPTGVNGSFNVHNVTDSDIRGNVLSDGWGEGINVGRGSARVRVYKNTVYSMNHVLLYLNRCGDCEFSDNLLYHVPDPAIASRDGEYSAAIVIGDESGPAVSKWPNSRGNRIASNVVVNAGKLFQVRNNSHNYDTRLVDTVIENNTFVAGPQTEQGIIIQSNVQGGKHGSSRFAANVIDFTHAAKGADIGTFGQGSGVVFAGNVWSTRPPQSMQNNDDIYDHVALVDSAASRDPFDVDNYRPRVGSSIAARGLGALTAAGEEPPPVDPPPDPDPEPGRDDIVRGVLAQQEELLETASAAITAARANVQYLIQLMNENQGDFR